MHLPAPLRAAVGLAASAADEARRLPDRAIELPMLAVSTALQMSMRAQQRYARLAERGDAILNHRDVGDEPPPWATFDAPLEDSTDDDPTDGAARSTSMRATGGMPAASGNGSGARDGVSRSDAAQASRLLQDLFGDDEPTHNGTRVGTHAAPTRESQAGAHHGDEGDANRSGSKRPPPAAGAKAAAKKAAKNAVAKKTVAGKTAAKKTERNTTTGTGKAVRKPRNGAPSRFDAVEDD